MRVSGCGPPAPPPAPPAAHTPRPGTTGPTRHVPSPNGPVTPGSASGRPSCPLQERRDRHADTPASRAVSCAPPPRYRAAGTSDDKNATTIGPLRMANPADPVSERKRPGPSMRPSPETSPRARRYRPRVDDPAPGGPFGNRVPPLTKPTPSVQNTSRRWVWPSRPPWPARSGTAAARPRSRPTRSVPPTLQRTAD